MTKVKIVVSPRAPRHEKGTGLLPIKLGEIICIKEIRTATTIK